MLLLGCFECDKSGTQALHVPGIDDVCKKKTSFVSAGFQFSEI